jgi:hypothetical protein
VPPRVLDATARIGSIGLTLARNELTRFGNSTMPNLFGCLQLGRETKCTLVFHLSANAIVKGLVYLGHSVNECPTFNFILLASVLRDSMVRPGSPEVHSRLS